MFRRSETVPKMKLFLSNLNFQFPRCHTELPIAHGGDRYPVVLAELCESWPGNHGHKKKVKSINDSMKC